MSQYLLLHKINVQNANAIAGLTYGFPAITNFLGFAHALSRKLPRELGVSLGGVAIVSHQNLVHARQPKGWGDFVFALSRNPLTHQGNTAPINEEGRLNMTVSLLIEVDGLIAGDEANTEKLIESITNILPTHRLAGGQIIDWQDITITPLAEDSKTLRKLMPGYLLRDRSDYLVQHHAALKLHDSKACLFDAWCDFAALKYQAKKLETEQSEKDESEPNRIKAEWKYVPKPNSGYLVPIGTGFCAISPIYPAGEVANVRDVSVPVVFAEAAYGIGEWMSVHRIDTIADAIWRYEYQHPWYVAKSTPFIEDEIAPDFADEQEEMTFN
jgi:CRISPR-associated protein Csy2